MPTSTRAVRAGWAAHRLLPAFEPPRSLDVYDVRGAPFDIILSAATISGLINRQEVRIYLLSDVDAGILQETLLAHIPTRYHSARGEEALDEVLAEYRSSVKGLVIYDQHVIDSVNVATTLAGLRDAIVVSPQQAERLQQQPYRLPVLADLRVYAWKSRLQAYRWATHSLLKETSTRLVAGMRPTIASGLRSYLVATRAFVYWLDPHFALPDPSNGWTMERCLMKRILRLYEPGTPHLGWFIDEPRGVGLASKAALPVLPSDYFYNMEVWTAVRSPAQGPQNEMVGEGRAGMDEGMAGEGMAGASPATTFRQAQHATDNRNVVAGMDEEMAGASPATTFRQAQHATDNRNVVAGMDEGMAGASPAMPSSIPAISLPTLPNHAPAVPHKIYVSFTFSDGDNLQFNQHRMYHLWQDPARGSFPVGWTISPVLQEAAPALAEYYKRTATERDELIAGASGAGYMRPSQWPDKQLSAYLQLTGVRMQRMGLTTVEVLDDLVTKFFPYRAWQAAYAKSLAPFGLRGILSGDAYTRSGWRVVDDVPLILNLGLTSSVSMALDLIKRNTPTQLTQQHFLSVYIDAWKMSPTDIRTIIQALDNRYEVVTPGTLLAMIARS